MIKQTLPRVELQSSHIPISMIKALMQKPLPRIVNQAETLQRRQPNESRRARKTVSICKRQPNSKGFSAISPKKNSLISMLIIRLNRKLNGITTTTTKCQCCSTNDRQQFDVWQTSEFDCHRIVGRIRNEKRQTLVTDDAEN